MSSKENKEIRRRSMFDQLFDIHPNRSLLDTMDQFFTDAFGAGGGLPVSRQDGKSHYTIEVALPGVSKEEIDLELMDDTLRITVDRQESVINDTAKTMSENKSYLERTIRLPENLVLREMKARYDNGVLKVRFPKRRGKKVDIE
ncbi:Hsp20 family protein [Pontibacillus yanchengensis]|uniref:Hsp20 family protein n=2 Tax=Pontibacillus yanchengensis TaxID=462910 RepID=A0ACC7VC12_9BACI|nr:Hsp20/alpha crystallin family protein [Pontibacillus yanchengensis]MYL35122.1 Hsp20 family protein [Pontibacillus yanchengensis]MYL52511.1 Hsp20 family protein [Pontibacillus yanchengensis]